MKALRFGLSLIRHGETQYNKEGLLQGQAINSPLSEIGLQQAEAAGCYLKDVEFSNVFVSDMLRAQQSFGIAEGRRVQEVREMAKAAGSDISRLHPSRGGDSGAVAGSHTSMTSVCEDRKCKKRIAQFMTDFCSIQVKERVKEFLEKILQQIGAEHWHDRGADEASLSAASETSPVEGKADDGVRGVPVHALVVTHGAYMCVAVRFFVEELHCSLPPGSDEAHMFALSPNTGLCRFLLTMRKEDDRFKLSGIRCVFVHRGTMLKSRR